MRRVITAGLCALVIAVAFPATAAASSDDDCGVSSAWGYCSNGESVVVSGTRTTDGSGNGRGHAGRSSQPVVDIVPEKSAKELYEECLARQNGRLGACGMTVVTPAAPEGTEIPPITITDLATFAPQPSTLTAEPDNLGVVGLPANFVATAEAHTQSGELFGFPVSVRFTPASFTFHFGDGQSLTSDGGGRSWDDLGVPQFTPTDTSHTYAERGSYAARVDVAYSAEIDLGVGWFPISGRLTTTGQDQDIRIYEARTALVAHTCTENPDAAGC